MINNLIGDIASYSSQPSAGTAARLERIRNAKLQQKAIARTLNPQEPIKNSFRDSENQMENFTNQTMTQQEAKNAS